MEAFYMIPISVCIITKDEEKRIEKCLQRLSRHPFELLVIDIGSHDHTKELAAHYADRILDFNGPDNVSLLYNFGAQSAANDWILFLSCDEIIRELDFRGTQRLILENPEAIGQIAVEEGRFHYFAERLFNRKHYHFEGSAHAQLVRNDSADISALELPITVTRTTYSGQDEQSDEAFYKRLSALFAELHKYPQNPRLYYEIGECYMRHEDYENAYLYLDKGFYLKIDDKQEYVAHMIISYGYALLHTNRIEKALALQNVYDLFNNNADFLFLMGTIYTKARMTDNALMEFLKATTCRKYFQEGTNTFLAFHHIGLIYESYGQYDKAKQYFQKAGNYKPSVERLKNL